MKRPDTIKRLFVKCECGAETPMVKPGDPKYKDEGQCAVCRRPILAKNGQINTFDNRIRKPRKFNLLAVR